MNRRKFLKAASGLFVPAAPALILPGRALAQFGGMFPGPGAPHTTGGGPATPARVQGNIHSNGATSSTTISVTLAAPVGNGNMLCVAVGPGASLATTDLVVTDDKGNAYTGVDSAMTAGFSWDSFYILNVTNGPTTITATLPTARSFNTIIVDEFSGVLASAALDGHNFNTNQAGVNTTNGITSNAATTTAAGNLIWGACVNLSGSSTLTKGTAFTLGTASGQDFNTEYLIQGGAGSISATWTGTTADQFSSLMMAFKHA